MKIRAASILACLLFVSLAVAAPAEPLTVLTYNLGLLRVFGSDLVPLVGARASVAPRELAALAEAERPQIMLLEEVWRDKFADAIAKELAPLGYSAVRPSVHSIVGLNSGLLLLVKAPLSVKEWSFARFKRTTFVDSFTMKGVLQATIQDVATGLSFVLVGTHTVAVDTTNGVPKDKKQVDAVMSQADQILEALRSRSASGAVPALLLGDFNVGPRYVDSVYQKIASFGSLREASVKVVPDSSLVTWDPENPLVKYGNYPEEPAAKIDHIFVQDGNAGKWSVTAVKVLMKDPAGSLSIAPKKGSAPVPVPLSDHYAFLAALDLAQ
jgi:hypothetical protein